MINTLLGETPKNKYSGTFFKFLPGDTKESLLERLEKLKAIGIDSIIAGYGTGKMEICLFDEKFYTALDGLVKACAKLGINFWLEDYSPFPTGNANGAYKNPEHSGLNKLFIDERHIDISGPVKNAVIRIDDLQKVVYGKAIHRFSKVDPAARERIGIAAYRMKENPVCAAIPVLEDDTAILLDSFVEGRFLKWSVPGGYWRVFVIFETYESSGRPYYMNLLSKKSIELEIEMVHKPIYEHLKDELGKTWNGFFYDEPEIGNAGDDKVFDFFMLPGRRTKNKTDCNVYPWSREMPEEMGKRDKDWLKKIPCLWYDSLKQHGRLRYDYMDAVSYLVRENYNGQVYSFCRERGIHYIGHVLEDENSHARLGCGPGHYFRQQYYQDEAGIDVIAGQILPGRDKAISWYGVVNSDGEFYHYGIAKLASSEARINPLKKNRSVCETFAMYGQQGLAERKFVVDHLLVNGVNRILFGEISAYEASVEYAKGLVLYTDKICGLLRNTTPVTMTAVLYHAEAEWKEGEKAQFFQKAGAELARNQISYDVIPADVFTFPKMYNTNTDKGLVINDNAYQALIIPACSSLPESVAAFVRQSIKKGYPVFFVDRMPEGISNWAKSGSSLRKSLLKNLADDVRKVIEEDIEVVSSRREWIRYSHVRNKKEDFYLIHNEAPGGETDCEIIIKAKGEVLAVDPVSGIVIVPEQEIVKSGLVKVFIEMGQYEMKILYSKEDNTSRNERVLKGNEPIRISREIFHDTMWDLELPGGRKIIGKAGKIPDPEAIVGCDYYGKLVYKTELEGKDELPRLLDLGKVSDCCEVILNGHKLGKRFAAPYLFDVKGTIRQGMNKLTVVVYTSAQNVKNDRKIFGIPLNSLNVLPYTLVEPMGMVGKVRWLFEK